MLYESPLSIYFSWSKVDDDEVKPIVEYTTNLLSRDVEKPFSRCVNLPVFYNNSTDNEGIPNPIENKSKNSIVFIFISKNIVANDKYCNYLDSLVKKENIAVIPIALDNYALNIGGMLKNINFIRSYDFNEEYKKEYLFISIGHEIYRRMLNSNYDDRFSKNTELRLFLSHAKDGNKGVKIAKALKQFIDSSNINSFFDVTNIAPGYKFDDEIIQSIKESTVIEIYSDIYSSRYWCQKEILCAKNNNRPIIAVDILEKYEDRKFPHASNVPCVHISNEDDLSERDSLRIISCALIETIRFFYVKLLIEGLKQANLIKSDAIILLRPPELSDLEKISKKSNNSMINQNKLFIYPDPPIYDEESSIFERIGIKTKTPLSIIVDSLEDKKVGISISDISNNEMIEIGQNSKHLIGLSQEIAKHLLYRNATLIYGGDLRDNGFTKYIFDEAQIVQSRKNCDKKYIKNYISWPIYLNDDENTTKWKANYKNVASMIEENISEDVLNLIESPKSFLYPNSPINCYVWSRCLTLMRENMIKDCDVRICAGGKISGYKGRFPGVLEEIIIAIELKRPIFLLGGFGGVTKKVCEIIKNHNVPEELTLEWQMEHNDGYKEILDIYRDSGLENLIDYEELTSIINLENLNNGLNKEENLRLFETPFIDESIYLILQGISRLLSY